MPENVCFIVSNRNSSNNEMWSFGNKKEQKKKYNCLFIAHSCATLSSPGDNVYAYFTLYSCVRFSATSIFWHDFVDDGDVLRCKYRRNQKDTSKYRLWPTWRSTCVFMRDLDSKSVNRRIKPTTRKKKSVFVFEKKKATKKSHAHVNHERTTLFNGTSHWEHACDGIVRWKMKRKKSARRNRRENHHWKRERTLDNDAVVAATTNKMRCAKKRKGKSASAEIVVNVFFSASSSTFSIAASRLKGRMCGVLLRYWIHRNVVGGKFVFGVVRLALRPNRFRLFVCCVAHIQTDVHSHRSTEAFIRTARKLWLVCAMEMSDLDNDWLSGKMSTKTEWETERKKNQLTLLTHAFFQYEIFAILFSSTSSSSNRWFDSAATIYDWILVFDLRIFFVVFWFLFGVRTRLSLEECYRFRGSFAFARKSCGKWISRRWKMFFFLLLFVSCLFFLLIAFSFSARCRITCTYIFGHRPTTTNREYQRQSTECLSV